MNRRSIDIDINSLTDDEFTSLCLDILEKHLNYKDIVRSPYNIDYGIDYICKNANNDDVAVIIKRSTGKSGREELYRLIAQAHSLNANLKQVKEFILMLPNNISKESQSFINTYTNETDIFIKTIDLSQIKNISYNNDYFYNKYIKKHIAVELKRYGSFSLSVIAILFTILFSFFSNTFGPQTTISERIVKVDQAINDLRGLESYLNDIKQEMIETQNAKKQLDEDYEKAKELSKLSEQQLYAIKDAITKTSRRDYILGIVLSFISGIAASVAASFLYDRIKKYINKNKTL